VDDPEAGVTDEELILRLAAITFDEDEEDGLTDWEREFLDTMYMYEAKHVRSLSEKQRAAAEKLLDKLGSAGQGPETIFRPPPGKPNILRKRQPWED